MREMSVAEQRYQAVLAVISDGRSVTEVAGQWKVSRQTLHGWLARYEAQGLEGLGTGRTGRARARTRCRASWRLGCSSCAGPARIGGRGGSGSN